MAIKQAFITAFLLLVGTSLSGISDPLLVVLLMVKNEKDVIVPTLDSYVPKKEMAADALNDIGYIIYDTGSTDGTQQIARTFFEQKGVERFIITEEPFVDFATSRNKALALARSLFPDSTYLLFPDAEWYLSSMDDLLEFCRTEKRRYDGSFALPPYYNLTIRTTSQGIECEFLTSRLFLTADDVVFEGDIHECPNKCSTYKVHSSIYFKLGASKSGTEKSRARWYRDRDMLFKRLIEEPDNPRTALYLGLTEFWLGNLHNAYTYLKLRIELHSFPEEDYFAYYKLGIVTMLLSKEDPDHFSWHEAHDYFLKAYSLRPCRAEPLIRIAAHYIEEDNHPVGYIYSKRALDIPEPQNELLEVERHLYRYDRWELFSRSAWYFGDYKRGEQATLKAIESRPNYPHLYRNLAFFWSKLYPTQTKGPVA